MFRLNVFPKVDSQDTFDITSRDMDLRLDMSRVVTHFMYPLRGRCSNLMKNMQTQFFWTRKFFQLPLTRNSGRRSVIMEAEKTRGGSVKTI